MVSIDRIDEAIVAFICSPDAVSRRALAGTGEAGLRRMVDHWYEGVPIPGLQMLEGDPRWLIDQTVAALAVVAQAAPEAFLRFLEGRSLGTMELSVLGGLRAPGATSLLCAHVRHEDWLIRYNAVRSLVRAGDPQGRACIEEALGDEVPTVRSVAIRGVSRWDPDRAVSLYESLLEDEGLTPLNRQQAVWAIGELRAGREVRDPLDPI